MNIVLLQYILCEYKNVDQYFLRDNHQKVHTEGDQIHALNPRIKKSDGALFFLVPYKVDSTRWPNETFRNYKKHIIKPVFEMLTIGLRASFWMFESYL